MLTIGLLNGLDAVRHAFFGREGGVSEGLYASLNCGFGSGDDKAKVAENRRRAAAELELPADRLITLYQVHSPKVIEVTTPWTPGEAPQADALVTRTAGLALGILTADCVPVLLADPKARVVGAAHAGWKGALGGVLEATVQAMTALGATADGIRAGIGPAIGQRSYEVGPEFPAPFLAQCEKNADFFCRGAREGHFHFDIKGYVARRLALAGLREIQCLPCDTCAEEARFFSYRRACLRQEDDYGRDLSAIALEA
ncbi:MAG TPA: peptidoglycan editing factor PgeF [Kiloniellaceae bacterium]|nr:peptidoglycan editing factor PgeF [Kiloniellaceae bacterium]